MDKIKHLFCNHNWRPVKFSGGWICYQCNNCYHIRQSGNHWLKILLFVVVIIIVVLASYRG